MRYTTRAGLVLDIGRIDRRLLDALAVPEPQPPTRPVETWGGLVEQVPVYADPSYRRAIQKWRTTVWRKKLKVISTALSFDLPANNDMAALQAIGLAQNTHADYLRLNVCAADQVSIVDEIYYQSTVTARGIAEAAERFNYTWRDKPLEAWAVGYSPGKRGILAVDYRASMRSGMTWPQFCELTGPEQSAIVAFWNLEDRLSWLVLQ